MKNEMTGAEPTSLQKVPDLINNLLNKKVEAVVLEQPVAEAYVQQSDNVALAPVKFEQGEKVTAIAMSKNTPELKKHVNESIKTINDKDLLKGYQKEANELMFQDEQSFLQKYGPYYLNGAKYTILLAFVGVLFGLVFGSLLALMKLGKSKLLKALSQWFTSSTSGAPRSWFKSLSCTSVLVFWAWICRNW